MLGDTVWAMVVRLGREDVVLFLDNRKAKGFNAFLPVLHTPFFAEPNPKTVYGHRMFEGDARNPDLIRPRVVNGGGPDNPNDFWDHIDFIVREAEKRGMYVGFLHLWGNAFVSNKKSYTNGIARAYGEFVGRRYKGAPNIFWVLGGDCVPFADRSVDGADQRPDEGSHVEEDDPEHDAHDETHRGEDRLKEIIAAAHVDADDRVADEVVRLAVAHGLVGGAGGRRRLAG